jgi:DNA-binding winged helix-turn-helix (wHTH) protein
VSGVAASPVRASAREEVEGARGALYAFERVRIDVGPRELWRDGRLRTLPSRVFDCLVYLIEHRDRAVGRDELVAAIWGRVDVTDAQLGQIVLKARRAIGDDGQAQRLIRTMPKFGYRWSAPVERVEAGVDRGQACGPAAAVVATPAVVGPPRSVLRPRIAVLGVGALFVATAWGFARTQFDAVAGPAASRAPAVVLPVEVAQAPGREWIRLGGMEVLAARLRAGGLEVAPSEEVLSRIGDFDAARSDATSRRTDARLVVRAGLAEGPHGWQVEVRAVGTGPEVVLARAGGVDPLVTLQRAGDELLARLEDGARAPAAGRMREGVAEAP